MGKLKKESGITLIALVVTIIVLLILAGVSISMLTGENGILKRAQEAKENTEIATEEEQNTLLQYEYEIAKMQGEISETETFGEYSMEREIKEKYGQDIKIGDTVNYNADITEYNGTWKVLGIENGQILLMSSKPVNTEFSVKGKDDFLNLDKKLDEFCEEYGKGIGAESARCLRVEDFNKITGYTPKDPEKVEKYGKGTIVEYGETVTFTLEGNKMKCKCSNGQSLYKNLTSFQHVDGTKLGEKEEISIENDYYAYGYNYGVDASYSIASEPSDGIRRLFMLSGSKTPYFHLANTCTAVSVGDGAIGAFFEERFMACTINEASVGAWRLVDSNGTETEHKANVMAVVLLKIDVTFTKSENNTWDLSE